MLAIGLLVSTLASRLRVQIENSLDRERHSNSLYELGKELKRKQSVRHADFVDAIRLDRPR